MENRKLLKFWLELNTGRTVSLAKKMGCSRQHISRIASQKNKLSDNQTQALGQGMFMVELDESQRVKDIERIIVKSAHLSHSSDVLIRDNALLELDKWVEKLGVVV